jgi:hypothetical protein
MSSKVKPGRRNADRFLKKRLAERRRRDARRGRRDR